MFAANTQRLNNVSHTYMRRTIEGSKIIVPGATGENGKIVLLEL